MHRETTFAHGHTNLVIIITVTPAHAPWSLLRRRRSRYNDMLDGRTRQFQLPVTQPLFLFTPSNNEITLLSDTIAIN